MAQDSMSAPLISRGQNVIRSNAKLAVLLLVGMVSIASAQEEAELDARYRPGEVPVCNVSSSSRNRDTCGVDSPTILRSEQEIALSLELAAPESLQCSTEITMDYFQRDTIARVNGVIENETCAASSGEYRIALRFRDEEGEVTSLEFEESWQRDDNLPVEFTADYPLAENVELIRLWTRGLSCTCRDTADE